MPKSEQILAAMLGLNSLLGLSTALAFLAVNSGLGVWVYTFFVLVGLSAFVLSIYRPLIGLAESVIFYLPQIFSYASVDGYWQFKMGLHFFLTFKGANAVYALNILALVLFLIAASKALDRWDEAKADVIKESDAL